MSKSTLCWNSLANENIEQNKAPRRSNQPAAFRSGRKWRPSDGTLPPQLPRIHQSTTWSGRGLFHHLGFLGGGGGVARPRPLPLLLQPLLLLLQVRRHVVEALRLQVLQASARPLRRCRHTTGGGVGGAKRDGAGSRDRRKTHPPAPPSGP